MKKIIIAVVLGLVLISLIIAFGQVFTVKYVTVEFTNNVSVTTKEKILEQAGIKTSTNIFIIDEEKVAESIEKNYTNNEIKVKSIVRTFPNKVTINVSERIALFRIQAHTEEQSGYVKADRNFQMNAIYSYSEIKDEVLIDVSGFEIKDTFNCKECFALKNIANAVIDSGIKEEALPFFIDEVSISERQIKVMLKGTDTVLVVNAPFDADANVYSAVSDLMKKYLELDISERNGITLC